MTPRPWTPARVQVVVALPEPRFAVWVWSRSDYVRAGGVVLTWETEARARTLLRTDRLVETVDRTVARGACVAMYLPAVSSRVVSP